MLESALIAVFSVVLSSVAVYFVGSRVAKRAYNDAKDDLIEWFHSEEGMIFIGTLGKLFGAGAMSSMKFGTGKGSMKIFGVKVPNQLVNAMVEKYLLPQVKEVMP